MPRFSEHHEPECPNCGVENGQLQRVRDPRFGEVWLCFECAANRRADQERAERGLRAEHAPQVCDGCQNTYQFVTVAHVKLIDHKACRTIERDFCPSCLKAWKAADWYYEARQAAAQKSGKEQRNDPAKRGNWNSVDVFKGKARAPRADPRG